MDRKALTQVRVVAIIVLLLGLAMLVYWGRRTIAGLLLMPPTRHNFIHLNEVWRLKRRRK